MVDAGKESFLLNWLMDDVKELSTVHVMCLLHLHIYFSPELNYRG